MKIILEDQNLLNVTRTDDAVKALTTAINNGQTRLAMELMLPVVLALTSKIDEQENIINSLSAKSTSGNQGQAEVKTKPKAKTKEESEVLVD